ncbi:ABC-F family ATP-binding cassette domain-containing protein [Patescibacteria group bacterium]|nr:ABC-F family ATP-binding cassette domain-containing protein [Patescibacteria group bacterium]MBP9710527.1 ABC-F family ATP-binding cassette domain-containing protein [Patescibacteria group bacterium]
MATDHGNVLIRFDKVVFHHDEDHPILDEASFSIRENAKITLMGQNGAGKSTIFKLLTGVYKPNEGQIHVQKDATVAIGLQVMAREHMENTVREFFAHAFKEVPYSLDGLIKNVLETVNLHAPLEKKIKDFSGGQQARLLLAYALIQEPDILLLDEPTNNLDRDGIDHLTSFLVMYPKTVVVISHDADFLNAFTEGVLHLDVYTHKMEQYVGNYFDVVEEIAARLERERMQNARLLKDIQDRKDKVNFFANKGGKMRKLASKLRDQIEEAEDEMVDVRRDDKTIRDFTIPAQEYSEAVVTMTSLSILKKHEPVRVDVDIVLRKRRRLLIAGPNGIGKSTLLKAIAAQEDPGIKIGEGVKVGYYRQDFSGLNFDDTAYAALESVMEMPSNEGLRAVASEFLITSNLLKNKVGSLSEGQKGLLCFAQFVLQRPGLLILDEPTNHINFRHLPIIAKAIEAYQGTLILVSHTPDFVSQIRFDQTLDLGML